MVGLGVRFPHPVRTAGDVLVALRHLWFPLTLVLGVTALGTLGYRLLLGLGWVDALYQAALTLSTVGYQEVVPFDEPTRFFTSVLIFTSVGTVFYTLTLLVATVVEGDLRRNLRRRNMQRRIESMDGHLVICGFGRVGVEIARSSVERDQPFVVIDRDPEVIATLTAEGHAAIGGDATRQELLQLAGVTRARALLACTDSDATNVYVILIARELNPDLHIVARSETTEHQDKLRSAGANRIVSPHALSGRRMVMAALLPSTLDFVDTLSTGRHETRVLAEICIDENSPMAGATLGESLGSISGVTVLGVSRADGSLSVGPRGDTTVHPGDLVIVLGEEQALDALHEV